MRTPSKPNSCHTKGTKDASRSLACIEKPHKALEVFFFVSRSLDQTVCCLYTYTCTYTSTGMVMTPWWYERGVGYLLCLNGYRNYIVCNAWLSFVSPLGIPSTRTRSTPPTPTARPTDRPAPQADENQANVSPINKKQRKKNGQVFSHKQQTRPNK